MERTDVAQELIAAVDPGHLMGFPSSCWSRLIELMLLRSDSYVALLDAEWKVLHANPNFAREIADPSGAACQSFLDSLMEDSRRAVSQFAADGQLEGKSVELHHDVYAGTRIVEYRFDRVEEGWLAMGRDQSVQFEIVNQMSVLVEDLEAKIERERALADELRALATRDALTGLPNRRFLTEFLRQRLKRYVTVNERFAVLCIDLDGFKKINDRYGHLLGDEALRRIAKVLDSSVRSSDCAARYGGEEFVIVVSEADRTAAIELAERLRAAAEAAKLPKPMEKVTISVGVACTHVDDEARAAKLLQLADRALYMAKEAGRNCVRVAD